LTTNCFAYFLSGLNANSYRSAGVIMDLHNALTVITLVGLAISSIAGIVSQIWKDSIEVEGRLTRRLTPAGWLSLGISLIALSGSVASELIRVSISHSEELQAKAEAAQKKALQEQEARWRSDMTTMLSAAKSEIEKNLENTINGFKDSQAQSNQTQAEIIASKQSLLESTLQHTNEIIVAGQPLTSLSLHWKFASASSELRQAMKKGQDQIGENSYNEQGGSPEVPYDVMEYAAALIPLLSYVARIGDQSKVGDVTRMDQPAKEFLNSSIVALIPLDESQNAILSFGEIGSETTWYDDHAGAMISGGFTLSPGRRKGVSTPHVTTDLTEDGDLGTSNYSIDWYLDPATLVNAIDKRNTAIASTAKLHGTLKVAILYDTKVLPFQQNNFGVPYAELWGADPNREYLALGRNFENVTLTVEVNGFRELKYRLKGMYQPGLTDEYDDKIDTGCTILEFEAI
jgi:hypothetical protein